MRVLRAQFFPHSSPMNLADDLPTRRYNTQNNLVVLVLQLFSRFSFSLLPPPLFFHFSLFSLSEIIILATRRDLDVENFDLKVKARLCELPIDRAAYDICNFDILIYAACFHGPDPSRFFFLHSFPFQFSLQSVSRSIVSLFPVRF